MKIYAVIAGLLMAFSSPAADVNITNVTRADSIPTGSYVLGTTGLVTRLLPMDKVAQTNTANLFVGTLTVTNPPTLDLSASTNMYNSIQTFSGAQVPGFTSAATIYAHVSGAQVSTVDSGVSTLLIRAGILTNLTVRSVSIGAGTNWAIIIMTNGVQSSLMVNYTGIGGAQSSSNVTDYAIIPANSTISICTTGNNATANASRLIWSFEKLNR